MYFAAYEFKGSAQSGLPNPKLEQATRLLGTLALITNEIIHMALFVTSACEEMPHHQSTRTPTECIPRPNYK